MITADQSKVLAFLGSSSTHSGDAVERIETRVSRVSGRHVLGSSSAQSGDYLDFSTIERRRTYEAVQVNRRTASELYRGVVAVTREPDGSLALGDPAHQWTGSSKWPGSIRTASSIGSQRAEP